MTRVPDARLFIKSHGLGDAQLRAAMVARLHSRGVDEQRLVIMGREPETSRHLALYGEVDIALDTFPYNGTTTTCEALWQGVPVVCLEGAMHVSRVGQTVHQAVGLEELTGQDVDGYVELAVRLANDPDRLRELRRSMRERMLQSPLCDQPAFARNFEEALRGVWREWCGKP
jgi:protein O-GlcNAc transferase